MGGSRKATAHAQGEAQERPVKTLSLHLRQSLAQRQPTIIKKQTYDKHQQTPGKRENLISRVTTLFQEQQKKHKANKETSMLTVSFILKKTKNRNSY